MQRPDRLYAVPARCPALQVTDPAARRPPARPRPITSGVTTRTRLWRFEGRPPVAGLVGAGVARRCSSARTARRRQPESRRTPLRGTPVRGPLTGGLVASAHAEPQIEKGLVLLLGPSPRCRGFVDRHTREGNMAPPLPHLISWSATVSRYAGRPDRRPCRAAPRSPNRHPASPHSRRFHP